MAEPISMSAGALIWEFVLKPIVDDIKKEYGSETKKLLKESLNKLFKKLPFSKKEIELIETEIIEADIKVLSDKKRFLKYLQNNQTIQNILNQSTYNIGENYGVQHNEGNVTINNYPNQ